MIYCIGTKLYSTRMCRTECATIRSTLDCIFEIPGPVNLSFSVTVDFIWELLLFFIACYISKSSLCVGLQPPWLESVAFLHESHSNDFGVSNIDENRKSAYKLIFRG